MAFYYLLLGHLTGDFVLQTDRIAENKSVHWKWTLLHAVIVTLCICLFSYPFGALLLGMVLLNGAAHYIIDYYKGRICKSLHMPDLVCFLLDQLIHILILYLISKTAVCANPLPVDTATIRFLIVLVLVTSVSAVFAQFVLAALFPRADSLFFEEGEKRMGILTRIYVSCVFYLTFVKSPYCILLLVLAAVMFFLKFRLSWNRWMSPLHLISKLLLDTMISAACILLII